MWLHPDIVMKEIPSGINHNSEVIAQNNAEMPADQIRTVIDSDKAAKTTIPFVKGNEFDYGCIVGEKDDNGIATWLLYMLVAIFVITAVSNSANLTDGIDGLATGVSVPIVLVLGAFAWLSGNIIYAGYLNFMYIPGSGELLVYAAAMAGALMGFLWYNCFPAQVFMGDTGSLTIGGVIAVFALLIRKELLLPILCGIFLAESVSVICNAVTSSTPKRNMAKVVASSLCRLCTTTTRNKVCTRVRLSCARYWSVFCLPPSHY